MKMLQHAHRITITPEKRQKIHQDELSTKSAMHVANFCDLLTKYENGDYDSTKSLIVKFTIDSIDNASATVVRCSDTCYCILKEGRCNTCKTEGGKGVVSFQVGMCIRDMNTNKLFHMYG